MLLQTKRHNVGEHRDKNTGPQVEGIMTKSTLWAATDKVLSTDEQKRFLLLQGVEKQN